MAEEDELRALYRDCDLGAVPALSNAYGLEVIWDDQLRSVPDIYIEAGDHEHLVHLSGEEFNRLLRGMPHNIISAEKDYSRWMRN
jgi:Ala-tRNA(Pro) deacylase